MPRDLTRSALPGACRESAEKYSRGLTTRVAIVGGGIGGLTAAHALCRQGVDGADAVARFKDGSEIEADVIVGADRIHSAVRTSLFGPDDPRFTGKICYRNVVPVGAVKGPPPNENAQWLGPHGTIVLYPGTGR
jgi:2-polyprenyl-6-methoxyphenol hydroxylase-like FAD-dependent oxidoreductase